jgi:hypothetical protein
MSMLLPYGWLAVNQKKSKSFKKQFLKKKKTEFAKIFYLTMPETFHNL